MYPFFHVYSMVLEQNKYSPILTTLHQNGENSCKSLNPNKSIFFIMLRNTSFSYPERNQPWPELTWANVPLSLISVSFTEVTLREDAAALLLCTAPPLTLQSEWSCGLARLDLCLLFDTSETSSDCSSSDCWGAGNRMVVCCLKCTWMEGSSKWRYREE